MDLIIKNKIIDTPMVEIIKKLREDTGNYYFDKIQKPNQEHLIVSCAYHKMGKEQHPSASFYNSYDNDDVEYGFFKCFTCGKKVPLYKVVNHCFGKDENDEFGKDWLIDNFGKLVDNQYVARDLNFKAPGLKKALKQHDEKIVLDESSLDEYNYIHPYMYKRKLTDEIIAKFKIGYDQFSNCITFPCWDVSGNLVAVNRRSVAGKTFNITSNTDKDVYLLNFVCRENRDTVYVCESQINCLNCWSYGLPAVALLGTGAKRQYEILQKSCIRHYVLCLDPDMAGRLGTVRFIKNMRTTPCIIEIKDLPDGKDVNDLTKEEFFNVPTLTIDDWCKKHNMIIT